MNHQDTVAPRTAGFRMNHQDTKTPRTFKLYLFPLCLAPCGFYGLGAGGLPHPGDDPGRHRLHRYVAADRPTPRSGERRSVDGPRPAPRNVHHLPVCACTQRVSQAHGDIVLPSDLLFGTPIEKHFLQGDEKLLDYKLELVSKLKSAYELIFLKRANESSKYKEAYDKSQKSVEFNPDELVMLYWPIPKKGFSQKLLPKWKGPYRIVKKL